MRSVRAVYVQILARVIDERTLCTEQFQADLAQADLVGRAGDLYDASELFSRCVQRLVEQRVDPDVRMIESLVHGDRSSVVMGHICCTVRVRDEVSTSG